MSSGRNDFFPCAPRHGAGAIALSAFPERRCGAWAEAKNSAKVVVVQLLKAPSGLPSAICPLGLTATLLRLPVPPSVPPLCTVTAET